MGTALPHDHILLLFLGQPVVLPHHAYPQDWGKHGSVHFYQSVNVCHTVLNIQACYDSSDVMRKLKPKKTILSIHNQKIEGIILCRQLTANQGNGLHSTWLTPAFAIWENSWFALSFFDVSSYYERPAVQPDTLHKYYGVSVLGSGLPADVSWCI